MKNHVDEKEYYESNVGLPHLNPLCTRRQTLKWGGISVIGISAMGPLLAHGASKPLIIMEQAQGIVVADPLRCIGCGRCELACTEFNDGKAAPSLSRIKVNRNMDFGAAGIGDWRTGHGNWGDGLIVQDLCMQCPHPVPCANICPENAILVDPKTGARLVDLEKCTGCRACLQACPWEMISYDPDSRKATKCHLCQGKPKCVQACPAGSLNYVSWRDLTGDVPVRNRLTAMLPPDRSRSCGECHLPGYGQNIRQRKTGFGWIVDLAGTMLLPLALVSVMGHAVLRRIGKR
ncbi:MAG: Ion-translocating oxidoreductase complex subunit B [Syntrophus sp. SKADARSKE-3]|nr:Ion-translocating oxidoreductase complex subunit B [Syntrophus sp. SKADARSKE-3]